jgi:hypothetical protein
VKTDLVLPTLLLAPKKTVESMKLNVGMVNVLKTLLNAQLDLCVHQCTQPCVMTVLVSHLLKSVKHLLNVKPITHIDVLLVNVERINKNAQQVSLALLNSQSNVVMVLVEDLLKNVRLLPNNLVVNSVKPIALTDLVLLPNHFVHKLLLVYQMKLDVILVNVKVISVYVKQLTQLLKFVN